MGAVDATTRLTGGCQCGAIRYELNTPHRGGAVCHCRMCQKAGGAPFMAFTGAMRRERFVLTSGVPATYRSSNIAERGFCAGCGTPLTYRLVDSDRISVTIGSLDRPTEVAPTEQLGVESALPWLTHLSALPASRTEDWLMTMGVADVGSRQRPDHD
jgi:hypothetical protein